MVVRINYNVPEGELPLLEGYTREELVCQSRGCKTPIKDYAFVLHAEGDRESVSRDRDGKLNMFCPYGARGEDLTGRWVRVRLPY